MSFICVRIKNHFHINGFALSLALKQRVRATRKFWKLQGRGKRETNFTPITGTRISTTTSPAETNKQRVCLLRRTVNIGNDPVGYAKEECSIYVATEIFRNLLVNPLSPEIHLQFP